MPRYFIKDCYEEGTLGEYRAETARDALAMFSIDKGYTDPREDQGWFYMTDEGEQAMTFENTDLYAVEA